MALYFQAVLKTHLGQTAGVVALLEKAAKASPNYVLPDRWEEEVVLAPKDWKIHHYLGNYYLDRYRRKDAVWH